MDEILKRKLLDYGFFLGLAIVFSAILIPMIYFSQNSKNKVFSAALQNLLNEKYEEDSSFEKLKVGKNLKIKSSFSMNASIFELSKPETFAVVLKVETFYGPKPAAFICDKNGSEFLGWLLPQGKATSSLSNIENNIHITYWKSKIPNILKRVQQR